MTFAFPRQADSTSPRAAADRSSVPPLPEGGEALALLLLDPGIDLEQVVGRSLPRTTKSFPQTAEKAVIISTARFREGSALRYG